MIEILRDRRSVRKFSEAVIEIEKIDILKESVLRSPSSKNAQPCEFVFVDDSKLLDVLSVSKPMGGKFLNRTPLAIIVLGDENKSDVWVEDCSIAATIAQLSAQSLGLTSCWVQIRERARDESQSAESFIQEKFGIPSNMRVEAIIAVGYPLSRKDGRSTESLQFDAIKCNKY